MAAVGRDLLSSPRATRACHHSGPPAGGCATSLGGRLTLPDANTLVRDQLVIHGDFPLAAHHRLFEELTAERADLDRRLGLPASDEPIHVYLFETPERFQGFMKLHYPRFPDRRAFFVENDFQLGVYVQWGDQTADDLRHETTHAYLHSVVPNVPVWLDEGIAKYYEVPRGRRGVNRPLLDRQIARLDRESWRPDLPRLERLAGSEEMTFDDYAEAWSWVHFLIESKPERLDLLRGYLADLRRNGNAQPSSVRPPCRPRGRPGPGRAPASGRSRRIGRRRKEGRRIENRSPQRHRDAEWEKTLRLRVSAVIHYSPLIPHLVSEWKHRSGAGEEKHSGPPRLGGPLLILHRSSLYPSSWLAGGGRAAEVISPGPSRSPSRGRRRLRPVFPRPRRRKRMPRSRTICTRVRQECLPLRRSRVDVAHQRHVELQVVRRALRQLVQPRLAGAEVVVGHPDLQSRQPGVDLAHQGGDR